MHIAFVDTRYLTESGVVCEQTLSDPVPDKNGSINRLQQSAPIGTLSKYNASPNPNTKPTVG